MRLKIYNFKYALASAAGLEEEAMHVMKEAIIEKGFWYGNEYLNFGRRFKTTT